MSEFGLKNVGNERTEKNVSDIFPYHFQKQMFFVDIFSIVFFFNFMQPVMLPFQFINLFTFNTTNCSVYLEFFYYVNSFYIF